MSQKSGGKGGGGKGGGHANQQYRPEQSGILRFYTDDSIGLKVGPNMVLIVSVVFIGCVVLLHIWGKLHVSVSS